MSATRKRLMSTTAGLAAVALALSACGGGDEGEETAEGGTGQESAATDECVASEAAEGESNGETITLGFIPSWTDGLSTAYLLEHMLTEQGYTVEMQTISEAGPLFTGVAQGDIDIYPSAWPEVTHAEYMEQYGDELEDLGAYYENAKLTLAVPEYVDINSIEELPDNADLFEGRVVGIEPGAGHTGVTQNDVFPAYGLDADYELVTSSTTAMLAELQSAVDSEEPIVVTLWRPYWANNEFPVKDLEDPEGALGEAESLNFIATAGFSEEYPEVAEMVGGIQLDDEQYGALEDLVVNVCGEGREADAVDMWLAEYPDVVEMPAASE